MRWSEGDATVSETYASKFAKMAMENNKIKQQMRDRAIANGELYVTITSDIEGVRHIRVESKYHQTYDWDRETDDE